MGRLGDLLRQAGVVGSTPAKKVPFGPGYLVGGYAIDVANLCSLTVQSLVYPLGESPQLEPWALRFSPSDAYLDLSRLSAWMQWRVLWARIAAHYLQDCQQ